MGARLIIDGASQRLIEESRQRVASSRRLHATTLALVEATRRRVESGQERLARIQRQQRGKPR